MNPNSERTEGVRKALEQNGLDAAIVQMPENVLFLSGFWPMIGMSVLVFPVSGKPVCIIPDCYKNEAGEKLWEADAVFYGYGRFDSPDPAEEIMRISGEIIRERGLKRPGMELTPGTAAVSWNSPEFISPLQPVRDFISGRTEQITDLSSLLRALKLRKTSYEAEKIRLANKAACIGMEAFFNSVKPGISGVEIVTEVERAVMAGATLAGADRVRAYAQVAAGTDETSIAYRPNEISTSRRLLEGELAMLELGVTVDGYWADRTRSAVAGAPTGQQYDVLEVVTMAQETAVKTAAIGVSAGEVDAAARDVIRDAGLEEHFPHICGHGVGFAYHEAGPVIKPGSKEILEEGMIFTIEPGVYFQGFGGIRIEDNILITKSGAEVLEPYRKAFSD